MLTLVELELVVEKGDIPTSHELYTEGHRSAGRVGTRRRRIVIRQSSFGIGRAALGDGPGWGGLGPSSDGIRDVRSGIGQASLEIA